MKSFYLLGLIICFSSGLLAQNVENPCNFPYSVEIKGSDDATPNHLKKATLNWDFSDASLAGSTIKIEVVPILDCWEEIKGVQFRDKQVIDITPDKLKSQAEFGIIAMRAKCFKWRTVIVSSACTLESDWAYYSYLPKKS
jgi:hypothetical protein